MDYILKQRFSFSLIKVYKNYSSIDKPKNFLKFVDNGYPDFRTKDETQHISNLYNPSTGNKHFYKIKNDEKGNNWVPKLSLVGEFFTTKEKQIKRHYNNPFSEIKVVVKERTIKVKDNKVIISLYEYSKVRLVNRRYFKKYNSSVILTFDLKNGNILCINNNNKNKIGTFNKNYFPSIMAGAKNIFDCHEKFSKAVHTSIGGINEKKIRKELFDVFNDNIFYNEFGKLLNINFSTRYKTRFDYLKSELIKFFVNKKNIKVPDNYQHLIKYHYPTEKFLKKNDRKLISSILDRYNIKSKSTIKILHTNPLIDIPTLKSICNLFGYNYQNYISRINIEYFDTYDYLTNSPSPIFRNNSQFLISNQDKEMILRLLNCPIKKTNDPMITNSIVSLITDHLNMLVVFKEYYPNYVLRCKNFKIFDEEHVELSRISRLVKKTHTIKYVFNDEMLKEVESPIELKFEIDGNVVSDFLYPIILKTEEEYIDEGSFMHHCVASYSNKSISIIISVRTKEGDNRVTCEFDCQTGSLLQARHFCNGMPPEDFMMAVEQLKNKTKFFAKRGMLHSIDTVRTPVIINGIEVPQKTVSPNDLILENLFNQAAF